MKSMKFSLRFALLAPILLGLTGCLNIFGGSSDPTPPGDRQLPGATQALLAVKGMTPQAPIFIRIFKEESELEVWKLKDGRFQLFKTFPICAWSGTLGPKVQQGDKQAPEGFYTVSRGQLNPHSLYYLSFNIGFPNAYDRANGHTGSALMVHGNCKSAGCYAMTDAYIEEIYILAREALAGGQSYFHVHAYPFRMTAENMQRHRDSPWYGFWTKLKEGYDAFEATGKPPIVKVCSKEYLINVRFPGHPTDPAPDAPCPLYAKIDPNQMPGVDGVPQTMIASAGKPEISQPAEARPSQPVIATAALHLPNRSEQPHISDNPPPEMSASPVVTRSVAIRPAPVIASMQPMKPAAPQALVPNAPVLAHPTPVKLAATAPAQPLSQPLSQQAALTPSQPVSQPISPPPAVQRAAVEETPTKYVDPDALQKPNRSGKGGKLPMPSAQQQPEESSGAAGSNGVMGPSSASAGYGFAGTIR